MEHIRTLEKIALVLTLGGAIAVAGACFAWALAGCSSSVDPDVAAASSTGAGGAGGESSTGEGGAGGADVVCISWELGDDPNWQAIKDRCVDDGLPEPVCCISADEQPGCISTTYVDSDCGLVWCCP